MSNNKQSSDHVPDVGKMVNSVEWLIQNISGHGFYLKHDQIIIEQAKEMEIAGKEMSYAEGYAEGYKRSLELIEWMIKTEIKRNNVHEIVNEQK